MSGPGPGHRACPLALSVKPFGKASQADDAITALLMTPFLKNLKIPQRPLSVRTQDGNITHGPPAYDGPNLGEEFQRW